MIYLEKIYIRKLLKHEVVLILVYEIVVAKVMMMLELFLVMFIGFQP